VGLDEVRRLDEKSAGAAGGIEDPALVGLEHLDQQPRHRAWREELAAAVALSAGELLDEVLVDAAEDVAGLLGAAAEADLGDRLHE
jgi:hypothetical protein